VADGARKDFTMTSVHKDVAGALISTHADGSGSNADMIDVLASKTRDVIAKLEMLAQVTRTHARRHARVRARTHTQDARRDRPAEMWIRLHPHTHTHTHAHTHTHTHTHAHIHISVTYMA
jgi:hypothetical protein